VPGIPQHAEPHLSHRSGWLRAAVLGANDGIVSTASLLLGVAAATSNLGTLFTAGIAALFAGAFSMAVGEYVSVSAQRDVENADIARETWELENVPERELDELTLIYMRKGLDRELARQVAVELSKGDVLAVHMAEELGITHQTLARPAQAAVTSALSFAVGAALPFAAMVLAPAGLRSWMTVAVTLAALVALGTVGARLGGASKLRAAARVVIGGSIAMAATFTIGALFGTAVS
jgi:VIT1/CCC1 family predicted Fe2+/Mn2+ transporter